MGQCLSTSALQVHSNPEMSATREVINQLGSMNSAVTRQKILLEQCRNNAMTLLGSLKGRAEASLNALSLALATENVEEALDFLQPIETTLMSLIKAADIEYNEFEQTFLAFQPPNRTLAGVAVIHAAANSLSPILCATIQAGTKARRETDAMVGFLQKKFSVH